MATLTNESIYKLIYAIAGQTKTDAEIAAACAGKSIVDVVNDLSAAVAAGTITIGGGVNVYDATVNEDNTFTIEAGLSITDFECASIKIGTMRLFVVTANVVDSDIYLVMIYSNNITAFIYNPTTGVIQPS